MERANQSVPSELTRFEELASSTKSVNQLRRWTTSKPKSDSNNKEEAKQEITDEKDKV